MTSCAAGASVAKFTQHAIAIGALVAMSNGALLPILTTSLDQFEINSRQEECRRVDLLFAK